MTSGLGRPRRNTRGVNNYDCAGDPDDAADQSALARYSAGSRMPQHRNVRLVLPCLRGRPPSELRCQLVAEVGTLPLGGHSPLAMSGHSMLWELTIPCGVGALKCTWVEQRNNIGIHQSCVWLSSEMPNLLQLTYLLGEYLLL